MEIVACMIKQKFHVLLFVVLSLLIDSTAWAKSFSDINNIRLRTSPEYSRLIFEVSKQMKYDVFTLDNPKRIVVDFKNTQLSTPIPKMDQPHTFIKNIRTATRQKNNLRVVLDMDKLVDHKMRVWQPNKKYGYRVVLEMQNPSTNHQPVTSQTPVKKPPSGLRDIIIAVDAGHGGEDPGAGGRHGTKEKHVVLKIAKKLAHLIDAQKGMKAVMVRDGDYYVSLNERRKFAREHTADLFVSIHADAFKDRSVKGSSVYVLSLNNDSDDASRWLAQQENASDLVGGVSLENKEDVLVDVLLDLSLTGTIDVSTRIAQQVLSEIRKVGPVHKHNVQHAGFMVLKSPDIPSMLVETAFISNPQEEKRLNNHAYQTRLARSIMAGIRKYFQNNAPPGTHLAAIDRTHTIRKGDTLSTIAQRYSVSLALIRDLNHLSSKDFIRIGQKLIIPMEISSM